MKSVVKNLGIILATFIFILGFSGIDVKAETSGDYEYQLINEGTEVEITKYNGTDEAVEIPDKIDGKPVKSISNSSFDKNNSIKKIIIPEGVVSIGGWCFRQCYSLEEVHIPSTLEVAGGSYKEAFADDSNLKTISFGDGITTIPAYLFAGSGIEKITIPDSVVCIGEYAFADCSKLSEINWGNGLETIGAFSFRGCAFVNLIIPEGVTNIGKSAFRKCISLESVFIPSTIQETDDDVFAEDNKLKTISWGSGITRIPDGLFENTYIEKLIIPDSVSQIGSEAFKNCSQLTSVSFGAGLESIGSFAFFGTSIKKIELPEGLSGIGKNAFKKCNELIEAYIPSTFIGSGNNDGIFDDDKNLKKVSFGDGIEVIPAYILEDTYVSVVSLPDSVITIDKNAFSQCSFLTSIELGGKITRIGENAFRQSGLREIVLPNSVEIIDKNAFGDCESLSKVVLPDKIQDINSFNYCFNNIPKSAEYYSKNNMKSRLIGAFCGEIVTPLNNYRGSESIACEENNTYKIKKYGDYVEHTIDFGFNVDNGGEIIIYIGTQSIIDDIWIDGEKVSDFTNKNGYILIPVDSSKGTISFYTDNSADKSFIYAVFSLEKYTIDDINSLSLKGWNKVFDSSKMELIDTNVVGEQELDFDLRYNAVSDSIIAYGKGVNSSNIIIRNETTGVEKTVNINKLGNYTVEFDNDESHSEKYWIFSVMYEGDEESKVYNSISVYSSSKIIVNNFYIFYNQHGKTLNKDLLTDNPGFISYMPGTDFEFVVGVEDNSNIKSVYVVGIEEDDMEFLECDYLEEKNCYYVKGNFKDVIPQTYGVTFKLKENDVTEESIDLEAERVSETLKMIYPDMESDVVSTENGFIYELYPNGKEDVDCKLTCGYESYDCDYRESYNGVEEYLTSKGFDVASDLQGVRVEEDGVVYYVLVAENDYNRETLTFVEDDSKIAISNLSGNRISCRLNSIFSTKSFETINYTDDNQGSDDGDAVFDEVADIIDKFDDDWDDDTKSLYAEEYGCTPTDASDYLRDVGRLMKNADSFSDGANEVFKYGLEKIKEDCVDELKDIANESFIEWLPEKYSKFSPTINIYKKVCFLIELHKKKKEEEYTGGGKGGGASTKDSNWFWPFGNKKSKDSEKKQTSRSNVNPEKDEKTRIDPSGFVYEAVESNYVKGATTKLYFRVNSEDKNEILWDAESYEQINPQITEEDGVFHWDVPRGQYQVRVSKDGYEEAKTEWLPVLPPQVGIKIPLVSKSAPKVTDVFADETGMSIFFDKYLKADTISENSVTLKDESGNVIKGVKALVGEKETQDEVEYTKDLVLLVDLSDYSGQKLTIEIDDAVKSYSGVSIAKDEISVTMDGEKKITPTPTPDAGNDDPTPAPEAGNDNPTPTPTDKVLESIKEPATEDINPTKTPDVNPSNPGADAPATPTIVPTAAPTQAPEKAKSAASGTVLSDGTNKCKYKVVTSDEANPTVDYMGPDDKKLKSVTIPDDVTIDGVTYKVTGIGENALKGMKKLKSVTVGANVISIGDDAFNGCKALTGVTFKGDAVNSIGKKAFSGCKKLKKIVIPKGVKKIGAKAFYGCKKLTKITVKTGVLKSVGKKAFSGVPKADVKTPSKKVNAYRKLMIKAGINRKTKFHK